jgi:hypothetical protein
MLEIALATNVLNQFWRNYLFYFLFADGQIIGDLA